MRRGEAAIGELQRGRDISGQEPSVAADSQFAQDRSFRALERERSPSPRICLDGLDSGKWAALSAHLSAAAEVVIWDRSTAQSRLSRLPRSGCRRGATVGGVTAETRYWPIPGSASLIGALEISISPL